MPHLRSSHVKFTFSAGLIVVAFLLSNTSLSGQNTLDQSKDSFGLFAGKKVTPAEVGLPVYPGAKVAEKDSEDDSSAQLGFWGGSVNIRLLFLKLTSSDSPDKIATFYKTALGKYGNVLDCTGAKPSGHENKKSKELTCDDEHDNDSTVLKSGTREKQHLVAIQQKSGKTEIQLVYLVAQGTDDKI